MLRSAILAAGAAAASAVGLKDAPFVTGIAPQPLDGIGWTASNGATTIGAVVPGDLITDLQRAGVIGDPLYELNFIPMGTPGTPVWDATNWVYSRSFDLDPQVATAAAAGGVMLVFDGVKMAADVALNGAPLGFINDQFLRYTWPVGGLLKPTGNVLTVTFTTSLDERNVEARYMGCTGGWDWGPYSNTATLNGTRTFSKGIWKSVYLAPLPSTGTALAGVKVQTFYNGSFPAAPLTDATAGEFTVAVGAYFESAAGASGTLTVTGDWPGATASQAVTLPAGNTSVTLALTAAPGTVRLWWPAGLGAQALYTVTVTFTPADGASPPIVDTRRFGFRVAHLITVDTTHGTAQYAGVNGSGNFTMRFKINGADLYARGANMIPVEELEGRTQAATYEHVVRSMVEANGNVLRIWGGGIWYPDVFYDTCDELGVVLYHDAMYSGDGRVNPINDALQTAELRYQVRRLTPHPCIVMWDSCNECGGGGIWDSFVATTMVSEDASRPVWPSCPSFGWASGVDQLTGLPNGQPLVTRTKSRTIETHGYYQHGGDFPAVNGAATKAGFAATLPVALASGTARGLGEFGVFASEFGASVFSSFESMAPTLNPAHWGIHGGALPDTCNGGQWPSICKGSNPMAQRNYPGDNFIQAYWPGVTQESLNATGEVAFKRQLWQVMLAQALYIKSDIETRRSDNQMGTITWQLNEIWPTGGWGSLEYGTTGWTDGQVVGGRWKPLHHMMADHLYRDQIAACGADGRCFVRNDNAVQGFTGTLALSVLQLPSGKLAPVSSTPVSLPPGAAAFQWLCLGGGAPPSCDALSAVLPTLGCAADGTDCVLVHNLTASAGGPPADVNFGLLAPPGALKLPAGVGVSVAVTGVVNPDGSAEVVVTATGGPALFVTLTTLASGRFSTNAFHMPAAGSVTLAFLPWGGPVALDVLAATTRVEHLGLYAGQ